jgi:hypothetical protein
MHHLLLIICMEFSHYDSHGCFGWYESHKKLLGRIDGFDEFFMSRNRTLPLMSVHLLSRHVSYLPGFCISLLFWNSGVEGFCWCTTVITSPSAMMSCRGLSLSARYTILSWLVCSVILNDIDWLFLIFFQCGLLNWAHRRFFVGYQYCDLGTLLLNWLTLIFCMWLFGETSRDNADELLFLKLEPRLHL